MSVVAQMSLNEKNMFPPLPWGGRWLRPQPFSCVFRACAPLCLYSGPYQFLCLYPNLFLWLPTVCAPVSMSASTFASVSASLSVPVAVCAEAGILTAYAVYSALYMPYVQ